MNHIDENNPVGSIAIIGMTGRFPGAKDMEGFWENLCNGVESVRFFGREELVRMGISEQLLDNPRFVPADAILDGMDEFDASFFDYSAREAEIMDPQHRLFLESAWEVLESAGYNSELYDGRIAVYGSANLSGYMIRNLYSNPGLVDTVGSFKIMLANGQDFLATKVSYKMNLMGPSVNVNTLCSSSVVAVHYACQNLMSYGCDLALAGGVSFQVSRSDAFFYQEGGIGSSDGHCHAFDSKASGTVSGSGLAVVVLKRLEDAVADGDHILAVIRGIGINNDGSSKNSYTAPNADGQAECIAEAIAMSGVNPETITYIDAHGTGTDLGDPIEIAALTKAFRAYTRKRQFCAIGSVKTNIGHLVNAGGLASLVKTVLSLQHGVLPPSLNFAEPNPKIDFENSPFYVNTRLTKWEADGYPRRAGVSSFGIGGTNTHVILEEAPEQDAPGASKRPFHLIMLSAKTGTALEKMTGNLLEFVRINPQMNIADLAFTLQVGRRNFNHRRFLVCSDASDLREKLESMSGQYVFSRFQKPKELSVAFIFPANACHVNMGPELYRTESGFRSAVDKCANILRNLTGLDIRKVLYPAEADKEQAVKQLQNRSVGRGVLFTVEYALARLWMSWGIEPQNMLGEDAGEYVAACLAGVFDIEDALKLAVSKDEELPECVTGLKFGRMKLPFVSSVTGRPVSEPEAGNAQYWIRQRTAARFMDGMQELLKAPDQIIIEMGSRIKFAADAPGYGRPDGDQVLLSCMPGSGEDTSEAETILNCAGKLWLAGGKPDWQRLYPDEKRRRIPLPTYPFERQRYWIEPGTRGDPRPDMIIEGKEEITNEMIHSGIKEGTITLTVDLDADHSGEDPGNRKNQLDELIAFRERLEELGREFPGIYPGLKVSGIGLKTGSQYGLHGSADNDKLKKRPRPELETAYAAPRNELECAIIEKWQEVLGFDTIGVNDDFFELGGHSLIAAAVATELSKKFQVQIPMRTLFETTTAEGIAKLIETWKWAAKSLGESAESHNESAAGQDYDGGTI